MTRKTKNSWLFFNHPQYCRLCLYSEAQQAGLCDGCFHDMPWLTARCDRCALPLSNPEEPAALCADCAEREPAFNIVTAALMYRFPADQLIQKAKFDQQSHHLRLLADLLRHQLETRFQDCEWPDLIVPVPMAPRRLLARQYNHAALLADYLSAALQLKYSHRLLIKQYHSAPQLGLDRAERLRNLRNSFRCTAAAPPWIAVVDDVVTTGATATEIARTLKQAGAKRVDIWSVARTGKGGYL